MLAMPDHYAGLARLLKAKRLYIDHPAGLQDNEVECLLNISQATVSRYRALLHAYQVAPGRYTVYPDADDLEFVDAVYRRIYGMTIDELVAKHVMPWYERWRK